MTYQNPYGWYEYGLVILFNARSILSLLGVFCIVKGTWRWNREWDEQKYVETYTDMDSGERKLRHERGQDDDSKDDDEFEVRAGCSYRAATNRLGMFGWFVLGFSYFLERHTWLGLDHDDFLLLPAVAIMFAVAVLQTKLLPSAMMNRQMGSAHHVNYSLLLMAGYLALGILGFMLDSNPTRALAPLGAICIAFSPYVMWKSRIMGESFDEQGLANPKPVLFNFGGPLLVFGWFCFWLAHVAIHEHPNLDYIPFYPDMSTFLSFLAGTIIVVVYWLVGYALDEMAINGGGDVSNNMINTAAATEGGEMPLASQTDNHATTAGELEELDKSHAFGLEEYFFGYVFELKIIYAVAWALFGVAYIMRTYNKAEFPSVIFLLLAIATGVSMGLVQEKGLRQKNIQAFTRWMRISDLFLVLLFLLVCCEKRPSAILSTGFGIVLMGSGLYHLHADRKRGKHWLQTNQVMSPPVVFSHGALFYPLGMVLFSWGVSIHSKA